MNKIWMAFDKKYLFEPGLSYQDILDECFMPITDGAYEGKFVDTMDPTRTWTEEEIMHDWMVYEGYAYNVEIPKAYFKTKEDALMFINKPENRLLKIKDIEVL